MFESGQEQQQSEIIDLECYMRSKSVSLFWSLSAKVLTEMTLFKKICKFLDHNVTHYTYLFNSHRLKESRVNKTG